jgi:hypothetical protein
MRLPTLTRITDIIFLFQLRIARDCLAKVAVTRVPIGSLDSEANVIRGCRRCVPATQLRWIRAVLLRSLLEND